ncbi:hypothetical protein VCV18_010961 [Metarhizium anisopliae]
MEALVNKTIPSPSGGSALRLGPATDSVRRTWAGLDDSRIPCRHRALGDERGEANRRGPEELFLCMI